MVFAFILIQIGGTTGCGEADDSQVVHIPDRSFLVALTENGVDANGDGSISLQEAEATTSIDVFASGISSLSGIKAFTKLETLRVSMNPLSSFDISGNTSLRWLECAGCELDTLDISHNVNLTWLDCSGDQALDNYLVHLDLSSNSALDYLDCSGNEITELDLGGNPVLRTLICGRNRLPDLNTGMNSQLKTLICNNNLLTNLDISGNTSLVKMISCGNRLTYLDVSQNVGMETLGIDNMPTLYEVCVWSLPFPPPGMKVLMEFSPNVTFTTRCN